LAASLCSGAPERVGVVDDGIRRGDADEPEQRSNQRWKTEQCGGVIVEGTLTWYHTNIIAVGPGQFTWIFNPTDTINYTEAVGLVNVTVANPTTPEDWLTVMSSAISMIQSANYNLDVSDVSVATEGNTQEKQAAVEGVINGLQPGVEIISVVWNNYTSKYDVTINKDGKLTVTCITANFY
jgi:hypothetical protein